MKILAIDPGSKQSGWVRLVDGRVELSGISQNDDLVDCIRIGAAGAFEIDELAIEMMRARGMPVSNEEMQTLVWVGRFVQAWHSPESVRLVFRGDVKMHVCGSMKANDANIRAALLDLIGPQGTKANKGPTYGVKSHAWAALGVAVTAAKQIGEELELQPAALFRMEPAEAF